MLFLTYSMLVNDANGEHLVAPGVLYVCNPKICFQKSTNLTNNPIPDTVTLMLKFHLQSKFLGFFLSTP